MESTRDVRRLIEREIKKGSAPLIFEKLEYPPGCVKEITSESKLKEVLVYLFRIAEFEELANHMTRNNVYTENHFGRDSFHRRNNAGERVANYMNIITYAKLSKPDYDHKTYVESVPCFFSFPEDEIEKYRFTYEEQETYAFPLSGKHIINGLYLMSIMTRKAMTADAAPDHIILQTELNIYHLENIRRVLLQCLLLDDMHQEDGLFRATLNTIYLLNKGGKEEPGGND